MVARQREEEEAARKTSELSKNTWKQMQHDVRQPKFDVGDCGSDIQRVELGRDDTSRADSMMIRNVEEELACEAHRRNHFDGHDVYDPRITSPRLF